MSVLVGSESWTPEREQRLLQLWNDDWSAARIAAELGGGLTRNAVIGKVHRLIEKQEQPPAVVTPTPLSPAPVTPPASPIPTVSTPRPEIKAKPAPESRAVEHPTRGKYACTREGFFHARCVACGGLSAEMLWGKSGSSYARTLLKKAGWTKTGVTSLAVWSCADCSPKAPPPAARARPKPTATPAAPRQTPSLPTPLSRPAARVVGDDESLSQLSAPSSAPRIGSGPVPYLDRRDNQCAFLEGDPADLMCCGAPVHKLGSSWCEAHHKIFTVAHPKGRRDAKGPSLSNLPKRSGITLR